MVHTPTGKRLGQHLLCRLMPEQGPRLARMRKAFEAIGLRQRLDLLDRGCARHQR